MSAHVTGGAPTDFVQYLRDRGLVNGQTANEIRTTVEQARVPLGRLLLEAGAMTMRDIMRVLALQSDMPGVRFGELAIRVGLINTVQLEDALSRQSTARKHQLEVVRELELFDDGELQNVMKDYVVFLELRATEAHTHAA